MGEEAEEVFISIDLIRKMEEVSSYVPSVVVFMDL